MYGIGQDGRSSFHHCALADVTELRYGRSSFLHVIHARAPGLRHGRAHVHEHEGGDEGESKAALPQGARRRGYLTPHFGDTCLVLDVHKAPNGLVWLLH